MDTLPLPTRQDLGKVFTDPGTLLMVEQLLQQLAQAIPGEFTALQDLTFVLTTADADVAPNGHVIQAGDNIGVNVTAGFVTIKAKPSGSGGQIQYNNAGAFGGGDLSGDVITSGGLATTISAHAVTNAKFRQSAALSVVGNTTNAAADVTDIAAASDGQVLRRSGTTLAFGPVDLANANAVTGVLPAANGGSGGGTAPTYRGGTISGAITGTSATLTLPAGSVAGDFLVFVGAGGNGGYPTSSGNASTNGWTRITAENSFWNVEVFTRTLTSADITAGNIPVTVTGSFVNYCGIFTFATGAYLASFGISPMSFQSIAAQAPGNPTLTPTCGKVDVNPNIFWLIMVSCRGVNAAQGLDGGTQIGSSGTNTNGSASFFHTTFSGLPIINSLHNGVPSSLGDVMLGMLNP